MSLLLERGRRAIELDGEPSLAHLVGEPGAELRVESAQQARATVGEGGGDPQAVEDRGEFHGDVAAPDDERALWQLLEVERFIRGDRELGAGNRRLGRPRSCGDQDVFCGNGFAFEPYRVRIENRSPFSKNPDAVIYEDPLVDGVQARDLAV